MQMNKWRVTDMQKTHGQTDKCLADTDRMIQIDSWIKIQGQTDEQIEGPMDTHRWIDEWTHRQKDEQKRCNVGQTDEQEIGVFDSQVCGSNPSVIFAKGQFYKTFLIRR